MRRSFTRQVRRLRLAARTFGARLTFQCVRSRPLTGGEQGRDVLWQARCNAFRRALSDYELTEDQACRILDSLIGGGPGRRELGDYDRGCELSRLGSLSGIGPNDIERAVPLMGLQGFIAVEQRSISGHPVPILWVSATEHGIRYTGEAHPSVHERRASRTTGQQAGSPDGSTSQWMVDA